MSISPRVSIITPCYRHAHYLPNVVASAVAQTFTAWEQLIVDDGSPDDTAAVAEELIARYPDHAIRLIRQPNQGLSASRNNAIREARGEYIMPLDADDALAPTMLERAVAMLDNHPKVGFVYSDVGLFGDENVLVPTRDYSLEKLRFDCLLYAGSMFRKQAWAATAGYRPSMNRGYEDWDFWLSLAENGWQGQRIPEPLLHYRRTASSKLTGDRPFDLILRARLILNHPRLYPPDLIAWAGKIQPPGTSLPAETPKGWWTAFFSYAWLIARHHPRHLPATLLRPIFWHLSPAQQSRLRGLGRIVRGS